MSKDRYHQLFDRWLRGDHAAVDYVRCIMAVSRTWDDLFDGDKAVSPERLHHAFWYALVQVPGNPFFIAHREKLLAWQTGAILDWLSANRLERESDQHGHHVSFVLRESVCRIVLYCTALVGGLSWSQEVAPEIEREIYSEQFQDYLKSLSPERAGGCDGDVLGEPT